LIKFVHHDIQEDIILPHFPKARRKLIKPEFAYDAWHEQDLHFDVCCGFGSDFGEIRF